MSMLVHMHLSDDPVVEMTTPMRHNKNGWMTIKASATAPASLGEVTIFPPRDRATAVAFLRELSTAAHELAAALCDR